MHVKLVLRERMSFQNKNNMSECRLLDGGHLRLSVVHQSPTEILSGFAPRSLLNDGALIENLSF